VCFRPVDTAGDSDNPRFFMKVLVADDHALIRSGMRAQLALLAPELTVIEAADWQQTFAAAEAADIDLALIDLWMPGGEGAEPLARLLQLHPTLPVVVVSASEDANAMRRALATGAMGYLTKSEPASVLLGAIRLVLSGGIYVPTALAGLTRSSAGSVSAPAPQLTERQRDVLRWVAEGKSNQEIAALLKVARATVKVHLSDVFRALDVVNRTQAAVMAERLGLYTSGRK
jgi:DNA-binding NarL/FixJ family response regulator